MSTIVSTIEPREDDYELMERAGEALVAAIGGKGTLRVIALIQQIPDFTAYRQIYAAVPVADLPLP